MNQIINFNENGLKIKVISDNSINFYPVHIFSDVSDVKELIKRLDETNYFWEYVYC